MIVCGARTSECAKPFVVADKVMADKGADRGDHASWRTASGATARGGFWSHPGGCFFKTTTLPGPGQDVLTACCLLNG